LVLVVLAERRQTERKPETHKNTFAELDKHNSPKSRPLCSGDPGAAGLAHRAALLWIRVIGSGCRGLCLTWTALTESRFDIGYLRRDAFELTLITDDGISRMVLSTFGCACLGIGSLP
jgi:hypothetical protein